MNPHRFRPTRAGIVNLYEYGDQELRFSGGRLLLRGHNTSGKTKALELLLPFVLDGSITPTRLDPFARSEKTMKWNLVGCVDHDQRVGYVWVEFERVDEQGNVERVTAGIGLRAHTDRADVKRWHFVVRGRRVRDDLLLVADGRDPVSRQDLAAAIGADGTVVDSPAEYRALLRDHLLDARTEEQHQTMLRLMRELRRPHLSKTLEPNNVADTLAAGLPEVDERLLQRLAAGLEQLESLEAKLDRLRGVHDRVRSFCDRTYRAYLRAELRERASAIRSADSDVGRRAEAARGADEALAVRHAEQQRLTAALAAARIALQTAEGKERALLKSAAWGAVAEVEAARERAEAQRRAAELARDAHGREAAAAGVLEAELVLADTEVAEARTLATDDLQRLEAEATRAGLESPARALGRQLVDATVQPASWRELLSELATGRHAILGEHAELLRVARDRAANAVHARERTDRAIGRHDAAATTAESTAAALERERVALDQQLSAWSDALVELAPTPEEIDAARALGNAAERLAPALDRAAGERRDELASARADLTQQRTAVQREQDDVATRRAALEAERDEPPPAPSWRESRDGRPGAPLWALVDFHDGVGDRERAGLEAALGAAGLLDAWVTPDGAALPEGVADAAITVDGPDLGPSLSDALKPVDDDRVPAAVVADVLGRIGLGAGVASVDADGSFRLGPLAGAARGVHAEHIGSTARAARRARLIAELTAVHEQLGVRIGALDADVAAVAERARRLITELDAVPSVEAVAGALREHDAAEAATATAAIELDEARAGQADADDAELAARAGAREHAVRHELGTGLDLDAVHARREACLRVDSGAGGVMQRFEQLARLVEGVEDRRRRLGEVGRSAESLRATAAQEAATATRLGAEHAAREAVLGDDERAIRERHETSAAALERARTLVTEIDNAERAAAVALAGAEHAVTDAERELGAAREQRAAAHRAFVDFAAAALLPVAIADAAPPDHADASQWPMTRALEVARGVPDAVMATTAAPARQTVTHAVQALDRELAQADMSAHALPAEDGLLLVEVTDGAAARPFADALAELAAEIEDRERVLSAEERRVFSEAIVEELAEHLRVRVLEVHTRVARMNAVLRRAPTAAGKIVQLEWRVSDDNQLRGAVQTLRRSSLDEQHRHEIVEFFRERIELARRAARDGAPEPMLKTLGVAFDYRAWHRFDLALEVDGHRERLTRRSHAVGSGGEQSTLIHLPLFAAAAALYGDGRGPRLVMLDEALSGIDDETRERVLAATVAFDLDLVMTSHELWGTYVSVPTLAIYQLHRENGVHGVHAIPFLWDGAQLREDEQGELFIG